MRAVLLLILSLTIGNELDKVARANQLKKVAKEAYLQGDFKAAAEAYKILADSFNLQDYRIKMNLANAYYNLGDTSRAVSQYQQLLDGTSAEVRSIAHQQLGVIDFQNKKYQESLQSFKQALKLNPANEEARYNYELLKKLVEEQQKQQQKNKDQQQQQKDKDKNQDQEQQNQQQQKSDEQKKEGEEQQQQEQEQQQKKQDQQQNQEEQEGEEQESKEKEMQPDPSTAQKLKEMNISEEKARMILEAMKNNEIQYLQQNKRKAQNPKKSNKPDW